MKLVKMKRIQDSINYLNSKNYPIIVHGSPFINLAYELSQHVSLTHKLVVERTKCHAFKRSDTNNTERSIEWCVM